MIAKEEQLQRERARHAKDLAAKEQWEDFWEDYIIRKSMKDTRRKRRKSQTKEEAKAAEGDDKDKDLDYHSSEDRGDQSSQDLTYESTKKELKRSNREGNK